MCECGVSKFTKLVSLKAIYTTYSQAYDIIAESVMLTSLLLVHERFLSLLLQK